MPGEVTKWLAIIAVLISVYMMGFLHGTQITEERHQNELQDSVLWRD